MIRTAAWVVFAAAAAAAAPVPPARGPAPAAQPLADDPLPPGAVARLGSNRFRIAGGVDALAVSPDGKYVAASSGLNAVTVFDAATGRRMAQIRDLEFVHTGALTITVDGTLLAVGQREDGKLVIGRYDPATGQPRGQADLEPLDGAPVFSPDGRLIATLDIEGGGVKFYDTATGRPAGQLRLHKDGVRLVAFSPDGRLLGATTQRNQFVVFDRLTAAEVCRVKFRNPLTHFAFAPDGSRAAVADGNNTVALVDLPAGTIARRVKTRTPVDRVALTRAGELIAYSAGDDSARVYDAATGKLARRIRGLGDVIQLELTADGNTLVGGTFSGTVRLWDVKTGRPRPASADVPGSITQLWFPTPDRLCGFGEGYGCLAWDVPTGAQRRLGPRVGAMWFAAPSPDGQLVVAVNPAGLRLYDAAAAKELKRLPIEEEFGAGAAWFAPGGREVIAWGTSKLRVWDLTTGSTRDVALSANGNAAPALDVSPDGTRVAAAVTEGAEPDVRAVVRVLDLRTGKLVYEVPAGGPPDDLTFAPDGTRFAVFFRPPAADFPHLHVHVHDAATGRVVRRVAGDYMAQPGVPISPDGRVIALGGMDGTIRLLEVASGKDRAAFRHSPHQWPDAAAFSPDGLLLATAGGDVPVYVWDVRGRRTPAGPPPDAAAAGRLWRELGSEDAERAYRAVTTLERHPAAAVRLFRGAVAAAVPADPAAVAKWVAGLDDPAYRVRAAAHRELARVADRAGPQLRAAAARTTSPEVRERLTTLLDRAEQPTPEALRLVRAVEVLEHARTPEAAALLREWAAGAEGARLTTEAAAALRRLR